MSHDEYARQAILTSAELCTLSYQCHTKKGARKLNRLSATAMQLRMPHALSCDAFHCQAGEKPGTVRSISCFNRSTGTLFVCFRGTKSWSEVKVDAHAYLTTIEPNAAPCPVLDRDGDTLDNGRPVRVHSGFLKLFQNSFPTGRVSDSLPLNPLHVSPSEIQHVVFTGHSMGGAISVIAGFNWYREQHIHQRHHREAHPFAAVKVHVVTFGTPAVGNRSFFCALRALHVPITAFLHRADLVAQAFTLYEQPTHWLRSAVTARSNTKEMIRVPFEAQRIDFHTLSKTFQTRNWLTGARIPVFNQRDWEHFMLGCDSQEHDSRHQGWRRFVSMTCFPSWPPDTRSWRKNPTRQLYDQYYVSVPQSQTWDLSPPTHEQKVSLKEVKKSHNMNTYREHLMNEFQNQHLISNK
jgi:hypothetical protein